MVTRLANMKAKQDLLIPLTNRVFTTVAGESKYRSRSAHSTTRPPDLELNNPSLSMKKNQTILNLGDAVPLDAAGHNTSQDNMISYRYL